MSNDVSVPQAPRWPFLLGDLLLLGCAVVIYQQAVLPFSPWELAGVVTCVSAGAWLAVWPFLLEYQAQVRLADTGNLSDAIARIQQVQKVADHISTATAQWQGVQESCAKSVASAGELQEQMDRKVKDFTEFLRKANDTERAALRLEVEKLRRTEADWIQVLVRVLDHVLALHGAAVRSSQPQVATQITLFRDAVLDVARRVGVSPFGASPGSAYDATVHQRANEKAEPPVQAKVAEMLAPGYTYQGRPVRRALVQLEGESPVPPANSEAQVVTPSAEPVTS
jgi:molecular chaperone GrpE (heat shock protein)